MINKLSRWERVRAINSYLLDQAPQLPVVSEDRSVEVNEHFEFTSLDSLIDIINCNAKLCLPGTQAAAKKEIARRMKILNRCMYTNGASNNDNS